MDYKIQSNSDLDTIELAQNIESERFDKMVICLYGDLGSGKTLFTKAFAKSMGIVDNITSPTFNIIKEYNGEIVSLGADSSQFKIEITDKDIPQVKLPDDFQPELEGEIGRVVLESPAYISDDTLKKACFSITGTIPFKFMETTIETDDYSRLGKEITHSGRYELFQSGSVFYFLKQDDMDDFITAVQGEKDFNNIGYNHIMNIK